MVHISNLKIGDKFRAATSLGDGWNTTIEIFHKISRVNHNGDNALCEKSGRTTFFNNEEWIEKVEEK